ncbi:uncharacterized protein C8A04DRAFT_28280 [Dichotomopilus funicola]|uniref:Uncharacterized protein n=1 Tax=Dichotomopilus funicola TaxID=1934379 RepID=A0AAN6V339_9PEZI|nr:hypothetical protein C8A04DRAFT_28280 [Dichotomopilus funicola]
MVSLLTWRQAILAALCITAHASPHHIHPRQLLIPVGLIQNQNVALLGQLQGILQNILAGNLLLGNNNNNTATTTAAAATIDTAAASATTDTAAALAETAASSDTAAATAAAETAAATSAAASNGTLFLGGGNSKLSGSTGLNLGQLLSVITGQLNIGGAGAGAGANGLAGLNLQDILGLIGGGQQQNGAGAAGLGLGDLLGLLKGQQQGGAASTTAAAAEATAAADAGNKNVDNSAASVSRADLQRMLQEVVAAQQAQADALARVRANNLGRPRVGV